MILEGFLFLILCGLEPRVMLLLIEYLESQKGSLLITCYSLQDFQRTLCNFSVKSRT